MKNENANPYFRQQFPSSHMIRSERTEIGSKRIVGNSAAAPKPTNEETKKKNKNKTSRTRFSAFAIKLHECEKIPSEWNEKSNTETNLWPAASMWAVAAYRCCSVLCVCKHCSVNWVNLFSIDTIHNSMEAIRMHTQNACTRERNTGTYTGRSLLSSTSRRPQKTKRVKSNSCANKEILQQLLSIEVHTVLLTELPAIGRCKLLCCDQCAAGGCVGVCLDT